MSNTRLVPYPTIRFDLGDPRGMSSLSWRVWVTPGDVYTGCRDNYEVLKVSLHQSGRWRMGLTAAGATATAHLRPPGADRAWDVWDRPDAHLRNTATWHYAGPKNQKWIGKALRDAADHEGSFRFGATMGTVRADFADEMILQFAVQQSPGDDEAQLAALRLLYNRVAALCTDDCGNPARSRRPRGLLRRRKNVINFA